MGWKKNIQKLNSQLAYDFEQDVKTSISNETKKQQILEKSQKFFEFSPYKSIFQLNRYLKDKNKPTKLSIMHINIRSLKAYFDTFITNLCLFERLPDIICINKTRLDHDQSLKEYRIPNYSLYVSKRSGQKLPEGGIAIYVNNAFKVFAQDNLVSEDQEFESMFMEIQTQSISFVCGVINRSHDFSKRDCHEGFRTHLKNLFEKLIDHENVFICGDFDYDLDCVSMPKDEFVRCMCENDFLPCIYRPTKYSIRNANDPSLVDNIWVNKPELVSKSAVLIDSFGSNHLAVYCTLQTSLPHFPGKKYDFTESNLQFFSEALDKLNWKAQGENVNELFDEFRENLIEATKSINLVPKKSFGISWKNGPAEFLIKNLEMLAPPQLKNFCDQFDPHFQISSRKNNCKWLRKVLNKQHSYSLYFYTKMLVQFCHETAQNWFEHSKSSFPKLAKIRQLVQTSAAISNESLTVQVIEEVLFSKARVAIPDNFGASLDPFDQAMPVEISLDKHEKGENLVFFESLIRSSNIKTCFTADFLFPIEMLICLPQINVSNKIFDFLNKIFCFSVKNCEHIHFPSSVEFKSKSGKTHKLSMSPFKALLEHMVITLTLENLPLSQAVFSQTVFGDFPIVKRSRQKSDCLFAALNKIGMALAKDQFVLALTFDFGGAFNYITSNPDQLLLKFEEYFSRDRYVYQWFSEYLQNSKKHSSLSIIWRLLFYTFVIGFYKELPGLMVYEHEHILIIADNNLNSIISTIQRISLENFLSPKINPQKCQFIVFRPKNDTRTEIPGALSFLGQTVYRVTEVTFLDTKFHVDQNFEAFNTQLSKTFLNLQRVIRRSCDGHLENKKMESLLCHYTELYINYVRQLS